MMDPSDSQEIDSAGNGTLRGEIRQTDRHVYLESYAINSISTFQITKNYKQQVIRRNKKQTVVTNIIHRQRMV